MSSFEDDEEDYPSKRRRTDCNDERSLRPMVANCNVDSYQEEDGDGLLLNFTSDDKRRPRRDDENCGGVGGKEESSDEEIYDSDSDIPLDDIDNMLEEGLREGLEKGKASSRQHSYPTHEERKKIVLKSK